LHVNGSYTFKADRQAVYDLMMSSDALAHCLPGCENMEEIGEDRWRATLKIGIAGIKGTYVCTIAITERVPPDTWTLSVDGSAKTGNLKGVGRFSLAEKDDGTELSYDGDADLMGPLAGVGQRVMAPASRMIIGRFFECMSGQLEQGGQ
jgi:carbon monoxide dehydrogenase subunit G